MNREDFVRESIAKYKKKIETLHEIIRELQLELGESDQSAAPNDVSADLSSASSKGIPDITEWQFLGKSQPEAAKALLKQVRHPLTTEQIVEGIKKGGVQVKAQKFTFYAILNRTPGLVRVRRNTWGLAEWPGMPKKTAVAKKPHKARSVKTTRVTVKRPKKKVAQENETASD